MEWVHDFHSIGKLLDGCSLEPGEDIHRDDFDALTPVRRPVTQPLFEDLLRPSGHHVEQACFTCSLANQGEVDDDSDVFVPQASVAPHMLVDTDHTHRRIGSLIRSQCPSVSNAEYRYARTLQTSQRTRTLSRDQRPGPAGPVLLGRSWPGPVPRSWCRGATRGRIRRICSDTGECGESWAGGQKVRGPVGENRVPGTAVAPIVGTQSSVVFGRHLRIALPAVMCSTMQGKSRSLSRQNVVRSRVENIGLSTSRSFGWRV